MKSKFILPAFLFVFGVIGLLAVLIRCSLTPIDPIQTESSDITLRVETSEIITTCTETVTSTTSTDESTSTNNSTTTGMTETVIITPTTTETVAESILETKLETSIETTTDETTAFVSTVLETTVQETTTYIESPFNDKRVKIDMGFRGSYYTGGWCTKGGSGRTLIPYNTTDEIRGSVASYYLWNRYKYDLGGRTKIYIEVPQFPEMNGYYYLDDCCSELLPNTIDFFCYNSNPCPLMLPIEKPIGVTFDIQCWIVKE